jgi:hypothetical protein
VVARECLTVEERDIIGNALIEMGDAQIREANALIEMGRIKAARKQ